MYSFKAQAVRKYFSVVVVIIALVMAALFFHNQALCVQPEAQVTNQSIQKSKPVVYLFWGSGCHVCDELKPFLEEMKQKYPGLEVKDYEVFDNEENKELLLKALEEYDSRFSGVPVTFIGEKKLQGASKFVKEELEAAIGSYMVEGCVNVVSKLEAESKVPELDAGEGREQESQNTEPRNTEPRNTEPRNTVQPDNTGSEPVEKVQPEDDNTGQSPESDADLNQAPDEADNGSNTGTEKTDSKGTAADDISEQQDRNEEDAFFDVPLLGRMNAAELSIPLTTVILAGIDSFNPCAFFVLFSLLGLLVHARSRSRVLLIGSIFVFFSGLIYFLFMAAWLNLFLVLGNIKTITFIAGAAALLIAVINIKDFFFYKKGISLTIPDDAKPKLFDRMRKLVKSASLPSVVLGTIILAAAANSYELLCTAGFPMVFTRILTLNSLPSFTYYMYLILYNLVYIIPLSIIVVIFTITLGKRNITEWQGRVLKFVSGTLMLGLGLILVAEPSLLNNLLISSAVFLGAVGSSLVIAHLMKNKLKETD